MSATVLQVMTYRGKRLEEYTKEQLIVAMEVMHAYYEEGMKNQKSVIDMYALAAKHRSNS